MGIDEYLLDRIEECSHKIELYQNHIKTWRKLYKNHRKICDRITGVTSYCKERLQLTQDKRDYYLAKMTQLTNIRGRKRRLRNLK